MRGYFGIGVERIHKPFNVGNLFRSAHAFGASFVFTVAASYQRREAQLTDTSDSLGALPFYSFPDLPAMVLPEGCALVGVELVDEAIDLPSFTHPLHAAYVLGPEGGSLSPEMLARCAHVIKIPTKFCLNVGIAGVVVMYDRMVSRGRFPARPTLPGGPAAAGRADGPTPSYAGKRWRPRAAMETHRSAAPLAEVALVERKDAQDRGA